MSALGGKADIAKNGRVGQVIRKQNLIGRLDVSGASANYRSVITSPLRSAATISPIWRPDSVSTAPFWLANTIAPETSNRPIKFCFRITRPTRPFLAMSALPPKRTLPTDSRISLLCQFRKSSWAYGP